MNPQLFSVPDDLYVIPAPLLISYIIMSAMVWILTMDLAEMASYMPIRGMTIPYLVQRFVEPSLAFAFGT